MLSQVTKELMLSLKPGHMKFQFAVYAVVRSHHLKDLDNENMNMQLLRMLKNNGDIYM
jgi:hypothetical protein